MSFPVSTGGGVTGAAAAVVDAVDEVAAETAAAAALAALAAAAARPATVGDVGIGLSGMELASLVKDTLLFGERSRDPPWKASSAP